MKSLRFAIDADVEVTPETLSACRRCKPEFATEPRIGPRTSMGHFGPSQLNLCAMSATLAN